MVRDFVAEGVARGWRVIEASSLENDLNVEADVAIVGTGAGGGLSAEVLALAGLKVVMIEEGPLRTSRDFKMEERDAYPDLYQECAARKTKDKAINILQGRCVGGGTTVNWTSSFATPRQTLDHWRAVHGVQGCSPDEMAPWFERVRQRLQIAPWSVVPNENNATLQRGAEKLGWRTEIMDRNVSGCANLGYCGMGCPIDAKQSMLVTTIPEALRKGAQLLTRTRAQRLEFQGEKVRSLTCQALDENGVFPTGRLVRVRARHFILAGGAIGSPALLLRSKAPDPYRLTGKRTFLHPVCASIALMPNRIEPYAGAPQSIFCDHFLWREGVTGPMGYKLEVPPMHPLLSSTILEGHGMHHREMAVKLPYLQSVLALCRDGFHAESQGGRVLLNNDGTPLLDYPFTDYVWDGMRRAFLSMIELQFAAGAREVYPMHRDTRTPFRSWREAREGIARMVFAALRVRVVSAHVMGGCPLGEDPRSAVVNSHGGHHHLANLAVLDGSVFPTSIGSNPQVSIYGMTLKNATHLLGGLST